MFGTLREVEADTEKESTVKEPKKDEWNIKSILKKDRGYRACEEVGKKLKEMRNNEYVESIMDLCHGNIEEAVELE